MLKSLSFAFIGFSHLYLASGLRLLPSEDTNQFATLGSSVWGMLDGNPGEQMMCKAIMNKGFDMRHVFVDEDKVNPGNFDDKPLEKLFGKIRLCEQYQELSEGEVKAVAAFNREHGWKHGHFMSMDKMEYEQSQTWADDPMRINYTYYASAQETNSDKYIVLVPGYRASARSLEVLITAGNLRMMGFQVVVIHAFKGTTPGETQEYQDLNFLHVGGAIKMLHDEWNIAWEKIGVVGWSYGTKSIFHVLAAQPVLPIKAAWVDGVFWDQKATEIITLKWALDTVIWKNPFLTPFTQKISENFIELLYQCLKKYNGWDVHKDESTGKLYDTGNPKLWLEKGSDGNNRAVFLTNVYDDPITPIELAFKASDQLQDKGYNVTSWWIEAPHSIKNSVDYCPRHTRSMLMHPTEYKAKLKDFFEFALQ